VSQKLSRVVTFVCQCIVLLECVQVKLSLQAREQHRFVGFFMAATTVKLQQFVISD